MFYDIHTHNPLQKSNVFQIVNQYPFTIDSEIRNISIGIHPWYCNEETYIKELDVINQNISNSNFLAIGECGLDKRVNVSMSLQRVVFIEQIKIAEKYDKPIIIHCVAAYQEIIDIKKELNVKVPMIIHGYAKNEELAKSLLKNDFYLSFGKHLLLKPDLEKVFFNIPAERIFLETDTSDISIENMYNKAQEIVNYDLKSCIEKNYKKVFNIY